MSIESHRPPTRRPWTRTLYALWRKVYHRPRRFKRTAYHAKWSMTLREWLAYHQREIVFDRCRWMGVPALKNPLDAWIYQEILWEVRPDVLIEIGSHSGGSTLFFAHLFDALGHGRVISIDIDRSKFAVQHERIVALTGDCASSDIIGQVAALCQGQKGLVIHDGDHSRAAVLRDLELYAGFVTVSSYLIVEDGILDLFPPGDDFGWLVEGPLPAIDDFLGRHQEFEVDLDRERYVATYNPRGFLKRVR